jgi:hypothetical protein
MSVRTKVLFAATLPAGFITACNGEKSSTNGATMKIHLTGDHTDKFGIAG